MAKKRFFSDLMVQLRRPKVFIALILASVAMSYGLAQIDLIPDVIPFAGYIDDVIIWMGAFLAILKLIGFWQKKRK